jgi:serine/threonine protein kinase
MFCCMTLRRFPWKAPRLSDNSYKLFVSAPSETPRSTLGGLENPSKSAASLPEAAADAERRREHAYPQSEPASRAPSGVTESPSNNGNGQHRHHHHHHQRSKEEPSGSGTSGGNRTPASTSVSTSGPPQQQVIKGPWRLLRLLPRESRHIIGRMLEVDPKKRATMDEILADRWVSTSQVCRQEEGGRIIRAEGHTHTLEPGASQEAAPPSNKK